MPNNSTTATVVAPQDAIRIVPTVRSSQGIGVVGGRAAAAAVRMTYRGGPLLTSVEVFTAFWGAAWQGKERALATQLNGFFKAILRSSYMRQLSEYSVPQHSIGRGKHIGSATVTSPPPRKSCTDDQLQQFLQQEISANRAFPKPNRNTLYFVFLPPGVSLSMGGGRSCQSFCGYHDSIHGQVFYAAMPYAGCSGCAFAGTVLDSMTIVSSHELAEAITDPVPGQGWYDDLNGEIGDPCESGIKTVGRYQVQKLWSNKRNACF